MTDAMAGGGRGAMEQRVIQRSLADEEFRRLLLEDPRAAVEQELGAQLPPNIKFEAVEETADTVYLVLPPPSQASGGGELSDRDLESVAGGGWAEPRKTVGCPPWRI